MGKSCWEVVVWLSKESRQSAAVVGQLVAPSGWVAVGIGFQQGVNDLSTSVCSNGCASTKHAIEIFDGSLNCWVGGRLFLDATFSVHDGGVIAIAQAAADVGVAERR